MKRLICLTLLALMMVSLCACGDPAEDTSKKTPVIQEKHDANGNILMEPLYMGWNLWYYNEYTYSEDQKLLKVTRYTDQGSYLDEERYSYGADGVLEKIEIYWENFDFNIELWQEKLYDETGLLQKIQNYEDGSICDYYLFEYDDESRCIKEIHYDILWNNGEYPESYVTYAYDDAGNCIRKEELNQHEQLLFYWTYVYDAKGNVTVERRIQPVEDEEFVSVTEYTYHDNGRVKDKISEGHGTRMEEIWDASGALSSEKHYTLTASGEWFLSWKAEYSGEQKISYRYLTDGRYTTESAKGNASVATWVEHAWYNPDGTLFCTNHDGTFYDPSGNKLTTPPDISAWEEQT